MRTYRGLSGLAILLAIGLTATAATAPQGVLARATRPDYVFVSWEPVAGALSYEVFRKSDGSGFSLLGTTGTAYFHDTEVSPGTSYLYRVRAVDDAGTSGDSETALATTVIFTDPTITTATTPVKAAHFTELGGAVNAARTLAGLDPASFATLTAGTTPIEAAHVMNLRTALDAARDALSLSGLLYTDSPIVAGTTPARALHVTELRDGVNGPRRDGTVCDPGTGTCDGMSSTYCSLDGTAFLSASCDALQGMTCNGETGRCEGTCTAEALATLEHPALGCDFYPVVTANIVDSQFTFAAAVTNPNDEAVTVTITRGTDVVTSLSLGATSEVYIPLPWIAALKGPDNVAPFPASIVVTDGAYRLRTTLPVTVAQFNPLESNRMETSSYTNDASLLIPAHRWGTEYWVASREHWDVAALSGFYAITASENDTQITIVNSSGATIKAGGGLTSDGSGTVTLHAGDVLEVVTAEGANDLTGTFIQASNPVQVIGGHQCVNVPVDTPYCDHLEESIPPAAVLSTSYIVSAPALTVSTETKTRRVRIVATQDGTALTYDPPQAGMPSVLNAGQWSETSNTSANFLITSTLPILVVEYMTGPDIAGRPGDPSMLVTTGTDRYQMSHVFAAPPHPYYDYTFVNIAAPTGATVTLDDVALPASDFTAIGTSGYSVARIRLTKSGSGEYSIEASAPVGISVYGHGSGSSYWY